MYIPRPWLCACDGPPLPTVYRHMMMMAFGVLATKFLCMWIRVGLVQRKYPTNPDKGSEVTLLNQIARTQLRWPLVLLKAYTIKTLNQVKSSIVSNPHKSKSSQCSSSKNLKCSPERNLGASHAELQRANPETKRKIQIRTRAEKTKQNISQRDQGFIAS